MIVLCMANKLITISMLRFEQQQQQQTQRKLCEYSFAHLRDILSELSAEKIDHIKSRKLVTYDIGRDFIQNKKSLLFPDVLAKQY